MGQNEVLAARFTDNSRVGTVRGDVVTDGLPQRSEHARAPGEMESRKVAVLENDLARDRSVHRDEVDDPRGDTGFEEQVHEHGRAVNLGVSRLPNGDISHQHRRSGQVAGDGREIEWGDCKDESL
jgi:hypothetical protein